MELLVSFSYMAATEATWMPLSSNMRTSSAMVFLFCRRLLLKASLNASWCIVHPSTRYRLTLGLRRLRRHRRFGNVIRCCRRVL